MKADALKWIDAHQDEMRAVNKIIWELAEPPLQEFGSSATLANWLEQNGFRVQKNVANLPTAFVAQYGEGKPVIGVLAEFDALPGMSQQAAPERIARVGVNAGHACGHSLFGTGSTAAALAVQNVLAREKSHGTIRLYGTPAEETGQGKMLMAMAGAFDDVDILLSWHAAGETKTTFEYSKALVSARFTFHGVAAHAAVSPHEGKSALDAVELMNVGVNFLREHVKEDSRIHYVITDGGGQPNVVPPRAQVWYYIRANKFFDVHRLFERVVNIARGAAMMTDTRMEYEVESESPEVLPNRPLAEIVQRNLESVGAPKFSDEEKEFARQTQRDLPVKPAQPLAEQVEPLAEKPTQGNYSTDVGWVSWNVPTIALTTACYAFGAPGHSWQIVACSGTTIGEKGMRVAAKALASTALDLLNDAEIIAAARADFAKRKEGIEFKTLMGKKGE
ncbi:MAG: amidohydrolase [Chloroflexi bacterium]|nr:amidohydrolase [Chloroflexota bacterium]